jgi:membrane protein DedA with SNARE-associated domain
LRYVLEVFALLLAGGIGAPIPEEGPLLWAGYHGWRGAAPAAALAAAGFLGIVLSDVLCFLLGRRLRRVTRTVLSDRLRRLEALYRRRGPVIVLSVRLVPLGRGLVVAAAGLSEMDLSRFLKWDLLGAAASTLVWSSLGAYLGPRFEAFSGHIREVELALVALLAVFVIFRGTRLLRSGRQPPNFLAPQVGECSGEGPDTEPGDP